MKSIIISMIAAIVLGAIAAGKAARVKEALWSIRCSIRYRLK